MLAGTAADPQLVHVNQEIGHAAEGTSQHDGKSPDSSAIHQSKSMQERKENVVNSNMIGLACLALYLPFPWNIFSIVTLLIQWVLLGTLFVSTLTTKLDDDWCPNDSNTGARILMLSISLLLFLRTCMRLKSVVNHRGRSDQYLEENLGCASHKSRMGPHALVDSLMEVGFTTCVILVNLWIVFIANTPLDMVLNSLALEFIADLDNNFIAEILKDRSIFETVWQNMQNNWQPYETLDSASPWKLVCQALDPDIRNSLGYFLLWFTVFLSFFAGPIASLFMIIYGPMCKGELES